MDADGRLTTGFEADGEIAWFWRAHAGAKVAMMLAHHAGDGGNSWFTGKSAYKP